jgi:hypothetical protein
MDRMEFVDSNERNVLAKFSMAEEGEESRICGLFWTQEDMGVLRGFLWVPDIGILLFIY